MTMKTYLVLLLFLCATCFSAAQAMPVGSAFTYQGELKQAGVPADGVYDFQFQLFNAASGGVAVSGITVINNLNVDEGLFTVMLDFGDSPFTGDAVFLQIQVKEDSAATFTSLAPRQSLTATPYSIQSEFVGMDGVSSTSIINGTITAADIGPNAVGSSEIITTQVQQRVTGICSGGSAMAGINQDGSVNCQAAGADTDWVETASTVSTLKNVAIGGTDATIGSGTFAVYGPFQDTFGGMFVDVTGTGFEQPFYGYSTNGNFRAWTEFNENADQWRVNINNGYQLYVDGNGRTGINEPNPQANLHVDGTVRFEDLGVTGGDVPLMIQPDGDVVPGPNEFTIAIPPAAFTVEEPGDDFQKVLGNGHAFIQSGFGALSAPVYLPNGATVTRVQIWYLDSSSQNMTFRLRRSSHTSISNADLAALEPTGSVAGIRTATDTTINLNPINNLTNSYYFRVFSNNWTGSNMGIRAVLITYRL